MHYVIVGTESVRAGHATAVVGPSPDVLEIFQDEREADGMFACICSEYDLDECSVPLVDQRNGLMRFAVGQYYSVAMYSRKIIV